MKYGEKYIWEIDIAKIIKCYSFSHLWPVAQKAKQT